MGRFNDAKLLRVGYWYNPGDDEHQLPDPREFIDTEWDPQEQAKVAAYLRAGETHSRYKGYSWCRFNTVPIDREIAWHPSICSSSNMGDSDLTDGVYIWPEGFAHYVEVHQVKPPEDFLRHVRPRMKGRPTPTNAH